MTCNLILNVFHSEGVALWAGDVYDCHLVRYVCFNFKKANIPLLSVTLISVLRAQKNQS